MRVSNKNIGNVSAMILMVKFVLMATKMLLEKTNLGNKIDLKFSL